MDYSLSIYNQSFIIIVGSKTGGKMKTTINAKKEYTTPKVTLFGDVKDITQAYGKTPTTMDENFKGQDFWGSQTATE